MRLNPFEEVGSDLTLVRKPSLLPWLLLLFVAATAAGMMWMAWGRLADERLRSADALQASDAVLAKWRAAQGEHQRLSAQLAEAAQKRVALEADVDALHEQLEERASELKELQGRCKK